MTDEEKALASFKKNYCPYCDNKMDCDISLVDCTSYDTMYRQSYLEGLAEGRKESKLYIELLQNEKAELSEDFCKQIEELKEQIKLIKSVSDANADENAELKEQNKTILEDNDTLNKWIDELKAQIEKMKCCYNCSKWDDGHCEDVKDSFSYFTADFGCDDWELAE